MRHSRRHGKVRVERSVIVPVLEILTITAALAVSPGLPNRVRLTVVAIGILVIVLAIVGRTRRMRAGHCKPVPTRGLIRDARYLCAICGLCTIVALARDDFARGLPTSVAGFVGFGIVCIVGGLFERARKRSGMEQGHSSLPKSSAGG